MDNLSSGAAGAGSVLTLALIYRIYLAINHRKVKSTCMGKEFSASIDIDQTTPKKELTIRVDEPSDRARNTANSERDPPRG
jgi:hypothetical protein